MKIGRHVLGKWYCLWAYEAQPAAPGKASFGELSGELRDQLLLVSRQSENGQQDLRCFSLKPHWQQLNYKPIICNFRPV